MGFCRMRGAAVVLGALAVSCSSSGGGEGARDGGAPTLDGGAAGAAGSSGGAAVGGSSGVGGNAGAGGGAGVAGGGGEGGSSGAGAGGGAGVAGGSGSGGATGVECPQGPPSGACNVDGQSCSYAGSPCGTVIVCMGGTWTSSTTCPTLPDCPAALPEDGTPCSGPPTPVSGPLTCRFEPCGDDALPGYRYEASCAFDDRTWRVNEVGCTPAIRCGECPPDICCDGFGLCPEGSRMGTNRCAEGQVCMRMQYTDGSWTWDCAVDACAPAVLDCSCVGGACSVRLGSDWQCTGATASGITCECSGGC